MYPSFLLLQVERLNKCKTSAAMWKDDGDTVEICKMTTVLHPSSLSLTLSLFYSKMALCRHEYFIFILLKKKCSVCTLTALNVNETLLYFSEKKISCEVKSYDEK